MSLRLSRRTFVALRLPNFPLHFTGQLVSLIGTSPFVVRRPENTSGQRPHYAVGADSSPLSRAIDCAFEDAKLHHAALTAIWPGTGRRLAASTNRPRKSNRHAGDADSRW